VAKLRITQTRSPIGETKAHRGALRALGLGRIGQVSERAEGPELAGILRKIRHLVHVEDAR
jgi:large subunit ribosomal protein L30